MTEVFKSCIRSQGDYAGVYEFNGETGYFYLHQTKDGDSLRVVDAIRILVGPSTLGEGDVDVIWDREEKNVGLSIYGKLCAVFAVDTEKKYGGDYVTNSESKIPKEIRSLFG